MLLRNSSPCCPSHSPSHRRSVHAISRGRHATRVACSAASPASSAPPIWSSHVSRRINLQNAVDDAIDNALAAARVASGLEQECEPDTAYVFLSSAFSPEWSSTLVPALRARLPSLRRVYGCTGYGVIGGSVRSAEEVENAPAISLSLARLPQADIKLVHVSGHNLPSADAPQSAWLDLLGLPDQLPDPALHPVSVIVLADPSFRGVQELLDGLDFALPAAAKIGGLSSSGVMSSERALFMWDADRVNADPASQCGVYQTGAAVMVINGGVQMELLIAQGCRPLSKTTWCVEKVDRATRRILSVSREDSSSSPSSSGRGEMLPLEALQTDLRGAVSSDRELRHILQNLTLGIAPDDSKAKLEPQDFLIRPIGIDSSGRLEIGEHVRVGQRIRFMLRDQQGAMEDLESHGTAFKRRQLEASLMGPSSSSSGSGSAASLGPPLGMLIFSCNGRGTNLYGEPNVDAKTLSKYIPVPCAGFHCNGEIGSIGGTTHLHGFTCAVGVLRQVGSQASKQQLPEEQGSSKEDSTGSTPA